MRSRITLGLLFGACGGFLGYLAQEVSVPHDAVLPMTAANTVRLGMLVGTMLGAALGAVEGAAMGSPRRLLIGATAGLAVGGIGGAVGIYLGSAAATILLFGKDLFVLERSANPLDFVHAIVARAVGWTLLGALPGLAAGASTRSRRRALHGLIGGGIGGFLGGVAFRMVADLLAQPLQGTAAAASGVSGVIEIGGPSRAVGFTLIGALSGLFMGLVQEWMKNAWVRVLVGRNEGRDFFLTGPLTIIGRDERADVPVFADQRLAPQHAAIRWDGAQYRLQDGGSAPTAHVNGQPVTDQPLKDGDTIQLGQVAILFRQKTGGPPPPSAHRDVARSPVARAPLAPGVCPYCGVAKDPSGACACSVPSGAPGPSTGSTAGWPGPQQRAGRNLVGLDGSAAGIVVPLGAAVVTIGREPGRDIVLQGDSGVSRRHAHIEQDNGVHVLADDGSSNGTYVNNVRVSSVPLAPGDVIVIGTSRLRYE